MAGYNAYHVGLAATPSQDMVSGQSFQDVATDWYLLGNFQTVNTYYMQGPHDKTSTLSEC